MSLTENLALVQGEDQMYLSSFLLSPKDCGRWVALGLQQSAVTWLDWMVGPCTPYSTTDSHSVPHTCEMPRSSGFVFVFMFMSVSLIHIPFIIGWELFLLF